MKNAPQPGETQLNRERHEEFNRAITAEELLELVTFLRSPEGCPWDREQSPRSLAPYFLEEAYELVEAIESGDSSKLRDELGDVLLHLLFQVSLAREAGRFDLPAVVAAIRDKMLRRHPHVFGEAEFADRRDQLFAWEQIKHREKQARGQAGQEQDSVLSGLPGALPALLKAYRIQGRVSRYHFDWDSPREMFAKLEEELAELRAALEQGDPAGMEEELGDLLFSVVNLARLLEVHPQQALERSNRKFVRRFQELERRVRARGDKLGELTLAELDLIWDQVKRDERDRPGPTEA